MGHGHGSAKSAAAAPTSKVLAFYTTGDPRRPTITGRNAPKVSMSEMWKRRAESLASKGRVYGVANIDKAIDVLKSLPKKEKFKKIFFVGHGFGNGYFFHGKPDPQDPVHGFVANEDEAFMHPDEVASSGTKKKMTLFARELARRMQPTGKVEIGFLACYAGQGKMIYEVCYHMNKRNLKNFVVGAYKNFYNVRFNSSKSTGKITDWADFISDPTTNKVLASASANRIPAYEVSCRNKVDLNDPLGGLTFD